MVAKILKEAEDNSLSAIVYQGKSLDKWAEEFNGEYTVRQLLQLIRSGIDLGRIKLGLVDEANSIDDKALFKDEQFFFENDDKSIKDYIMPNVELRIFDFDGNNCKDEMYRYTIDPNDARSATSYIGTPAYLLLPEKMKAKCTQAFGILYLDGKPLATDKSVLDYQISDIMKRAMKVHANTLDFQRIKNVAEDVNPEDEAAALDEEDTIDEAIVRQPEDVVTVEDFISLLRRNTKLDDKIVFRSPDKKECMLFDVESKAGIAMVDIVAKKTANRLDENLTPEQWKEAADWFTANGYEIEDDEDRIEQFAPQMDQFLFKVGMSPTGNDEVLNGNDGFAIYTSLKEVGKKQMNENRSWYGGGYGGTGQSYSSLRNKAPRGAEIGWYSVEQLDPKAKGKMSGWRAGPSNFPFEDLLYPNRKYKKGAMVMRNKYLKAGSMSGEKYISLASYFDAIKNNDEAAIGLLNALGIPLDLTFGMDPNDDYSNNYVLSTTH